jgi:hypothetical protein
MAKTASTTRYHYCDSPCNRAHGSGKILCVWWASSSPGKTDGLTYGHVLSDGISRRCKTSKKNAAPSNRRRRKKPRNFCASGECGYTTYDKYIIDHDYLDHGYIIFGYLDNDITTMSTSIHDTRIVTAGGKRRHQKEAPMITRRRR